MYYNFKFIILTTLGAWMNEESVISKSHSFNENNELEESSVNDRYYPRYHLAPLHGWLNDPTGFVYFQDEYHLFFEYNPISSLDPGIAHWGHAKSKDFLHWKQLPVAIYPDLTNSEGGYDSTGVFSGSAIVENDQIYIFYTANVNTTNSTKYRQESQGLVTSKDGLNFEKYKCNPILISEKYTTDIRDPKVWKRNGKYYMIIGTSYNDETLGRVVIFTSDDKFSWKEACIIGESYGPMGYVWECPDLFTLNGTYVFLFSSQGMKADGDKYRNIFQTGYMTGEFDYDACKFTPTSEFRELDHGHDFYATSTILDEKGRKLVVAWLGTWGEKYPDQYDGRTGLMTLPRELTLSPDGYFIQKPLKEMQLARKELLFNGPADQKTKVTLDNKAADILIVASEKKNLDLFIESDSLNDNTHASAKISYDSVNGKVILDRRGIDAIRRTDWRPQGKLRWRIFVDASSIELFCGEGEVTFSSRFFPEGPLKIRFGHESSTDSFIVYSMHRTVPKP